MASKRSLKKDVNFIANEIIIECFTYDLLFPDKNKDVLATIIKDVILFRNTTIKSINSVKNLTSEPIKNQFKNISVKMNAEIEDFSSRLQKLS